MFGCGAGAAVPVGNSAEVFKAGHFVQPALYELEHAIERGWEKCVLIFLFLIKPAATA